MPSFYTVKAQSTDVATAVAMCHPGDRVTGGGYSNGAPVHNQPTDAGDGWKVSYVTDRGTLVGFEPFYAYAICADLTP